MRPALPGSRGLRLEDCPAARLAGLGSSLRRRSRRAARFHASRLVATSRQPLPRHGGTRSRDLRSLRWRNVRRGV